ncbi:glycosyltransferase family 2 protein [Rhodopseudomonas palustris]|uniref:glycosyltransferase family 2 protein n=1 Tax=Rhodopseudomonas palustris TaxID=1076 RepID=UPI0009BB7874|nr:glycosyltransferase family 2 protein [Rhodopseudomonas palustris]
MPKRSEPLVTVAVPSFNQGRFLAHALKSLFAQDPPLEVFVADGGSTDNSREVIARFADHLAGWRSHKDDGQAAAINECIARGHAPYVCWLNSDDWLLPGALARLMTALEHSPKTPMAYGRCWNHDEASGAQRPVWVEPFSESRLALRCIISQPATLIRRAAWEKVGGVDPALHMAMDYDLWWRLYKADGPPVFVEDFVAVNRVHNETKTRNKRHLHYKEAIALIRKYNGRVPLKWWLAQPYAVWFRTLIR